MVALKLPRTADQKFWFARKVRIYSSSARKFPLCTKRILLNVFGSCLAPEILSRRSRQSTRISFDTESGFCVHKYGASNYINQEAIPLLNCIAVIFETRKIILVI